MRLTETPFGAARPIDGYGPGFFRIGGQVHRGAVLLWPGGQQDWAGTDDAAPLLALAGTVDVILLGMGAAPAHPPAALRAAVEGATPALGLEVMATPTACRSYNVLLSEGRRVAAALIAV